MQNGSDSFVAGESVTEQLDSAGDVFVAARTAAAQGTARGDLHVAGFDVSIDATATEDLYGAGFSVVITGATAQDATVAGFSVRLAPDAKIGGNARLFGRSVTIEGPVSGSLTVTGQDVILNAPISGDARIVAQSLTFGPDAVIAGTLTYGSDDPIAVPERVAPAERVVFEEVTFSDAWDEWDAFREEMPIFPTFASMFFSFLISLLFFLVLGALMLGFMPKRLETMRLSITAAPGRTMLIGVIGLSMLFGMVLIIGMTIVGLPFVPIVILAIIVTWILGYALGAYSIAMRVWSAFGGSDQPSNPARLLVLGAAITLVALLNFIPFVGWVVNYTLVLLGVGAMTRALFNRLLGHPVQAFDIDMKPIED
ncbi:MAG: hypothetical protein AB8B82_05370 [Roseovarius sp.]